MTSTFPIDDKARRVYDTSVEMVLASYAQFAREHIESGIYNAERSMSAICEHNPALRSEPIFQRFYAAAFGAEMFKKFGAAQPVGDTADPQRHLAAIKHGVKPSYRDALMTTKKQSS